MSEALEQQAAYVTVVGAGLAGCEAAWQLARRGVPVRLHEMKPVQYSEAHQSDALAELVCSNSLRADTPGNAVGLRMMDEVFQPGAAVWRAIGSIDDSGLDLRERFGRFDAARRFDVTMGPDYEPAGCRCGEVIQGKATPAECALFGKACTPIQPIGPCMVSSEGTCAAWYKYAPAT